MRSTALAFTVGALLAGCGSPPSFPCRDGTIHCYTLPAPPGGRGGVGRQEPPPVPMKRDAGADAGDDS